MFVVFLFALLGVPTHQRAFRIDHDADLFITLLDHAFVQRPALLLFDLDSDDRSAFRLARQPIARGRRNLRELRIARLAGVWSAELLNVMHILVVDDHQETRELLARNLAREAHVVRVAASCAEADRALAATPPDVVVLDVMLPDGSGFELCSRWRTQKLRVPIFE